MVQRTMPITEPNTPAFGMKEMPGNTVEPHPTMPPNAIAQMEIPPYMYFFSPVLLAILSISLLLKP